MLWSSCSPLPPFQNAVLKSNSTLIFLLQLSDLTGVLHVYSMKEISTSQLPVSFDYLQFIYLLILPSVNAPFSLLCRNVDMDESFLSLIYPEYYSQRHYVYVTKFIGLKWQRQNTKKLSSKEHKNWTSAISVLKSSSSILWLRMSPWLCYIWSLVSRDAVTPHSFLSFSLISPFDSPHPQISVNYFSFLPSTSCDRVIIISPIK